MDSTSDNSNNIMVSSPSRDPTLKPRFSQSPLSKPAKCKFFGPVLEQKRKSSKKLEKPSKNKLKRRDSKK